MCAVFGPGAVIYCSLNDSQTIFGGVLIANQLQAVNLASNCNEAMQINGIQSKMEMFVAEIVGKWWPSGSEELFDGVNCGVAVGIVTL
jgi:hypothetical protein